MSEGSRARRGAGAAAALALVLAVASAAPATTAPETLPATGVTLESAPAVFETTAEIMARHERMLVEAPQLTLDFFIGRQDSSGRKIDPEAGGRIQGPASGPQSPSIASSVASFSDPLLPQTVGVNANGPGSGPVPCGTPPDTMGAVGPTQFISFVNCNIVSYAKNTGSPDGVLNTTPNNFFFSVSTPPGTSVSDPHIRYDRTSQRWFLSIIDIHFPTNRLLLAVSNTSTITPSTTWGLFFVPTAVGTHTNCLADYPTPGVDANAIYVGVNQFCGATLNTASYGGSDLIVIQKSSVLGPGPIHATGFPNLGPFTPQGVDNADPAAAEGYVIGTSNTSLSQLDLFRVGTPGSASPTLSPAVHISTANLGDPIMQPHKGNTGGANGNIDAIDNRLYAATLRDGSLWTAMTVGTTASGANCVGTANAVTPTRDAAFWWEFKGIPTGSTPSINQAGIVCDAAVTNPSFYSFATIAPNGQGQAAVGFTIAGSVNFLSGGTAGRLAGDTPGSLQAINVYAPGVAAYNPAFDPGNASFGRRWGDYSFTSLDPCDDQSLWTIQEYVPAANQYGTRFAQLKAPPPATPTSASPPSVASGQAAVSVVLTGTSSAGSGFYDTPSSLASEPCRTRIASSIPGVAVNSVTWNSPTQVTLSLDTTAATSGTKTVTVTNPDGQSSSGSVLTITSSCTPPTTPVITTPAAAGAGSPNRAAGVANNPGSTYAWTIGNGTITAGQGTSQLTFTAGTAGTPLTLSVIETNSGCQSAAGNASVNVLSADSALQFYTVPPCRVLDTRAGSGLPAGYGPPSIAGGGTQRTFVLAGQCGIPAGARVVSVNAAVFLPTTLGDLRVFPAGVATPLVSTLNWEPNVFAQANAAIVPLSATGAITVQVDGPGTVDIFFDVDGYFQ